MDVMYSRFLSIGNLRPCTLQLDTDDPASLDILAKSRTPTTPLLRLDPRMKIWTVIWLTIGILLTMSIKKCCVPNCGKTREESTILHLFPNPDNDLQRFNTWKHAIGGEITSMDNDSVFKIRRVCHQHFETRYHTRSKRLSANAVPTLYLSGFSISERRPLQNVTDRVINQNVDSFQLDAEMRNINNPSVSSQMNPISIPVEPIAVPQVPPPTAEGQNKKKPSLHGSPEFIALGNKIKLLQKAKDSTMEKLKNCLKLSENPTFQKTLKKFTAAAIIFTMLQFREAGKNKMGRRFKKDEKIMALALYKQGPRAYRWMRKFFVLPSPLTLSRMITTASIKPGLNKNLFAQLKKKADRMSRTERLCVLMFDEVALTPHFDYNRRTDSITGFVNNGENQKKKIADHALVFMMRGLYKNYKQPIAYSFCSKTTPRDELVSQIKMYIRKLNSIGFKVIATVCDQGATNVSAINYLINETRATYLRNNKELKHSVFEIDENEVIPLYDPPHLIKGIRNNLLDKDLKCKINGQEKTGKWEHIIELYNKNIAFQGIRMMPKLTERHVIPNKIPKMKVKIATQVFSQTVAAHMHCLATHGVISKQCKDTADILLFFDNLFDSLNGSYTKAKKKTGKALLGPVKPRSLHKKVWAEAKLTLKSMKYIKGNSSTVVPSITNWLLTIENVEYMTQKLSQTYDLTSVWMRHFNQDPLENFFGCIRSHGYRNTSPTCAGFEAAFASLLVNNLSNQHSPGSNCEEDKCKVFSSLKKIFFTKCETSNHMNEVDFEDINVDFIDVKTKFIDIKVKAQLEYVTGYVLRKLKIKIFKGCVDCNTCLFNKNENDSILHFREYFQNRRCLTYPSNDLVTCFSNIQDILIHLIRNKCEITNIKAYTRTILSVVMNYSFIKCEKHKKDLINKLEDLTINLFLFSWCKDCNKLLKGTRSDYDENDSVQKMCVEYFNKRVNKNKK